jgi:hypothetical protein
MLPRAVTGLNELLARCLLVLTRPLANNQTAKCWLALLMLVNLRDVLAGGYRAGAVLVVKVRVWAKLKAERDQKRLRQSYANSRTVWQQKNKFERGRWIDEQALRSQVGRALWRFETSNAQLRLDLVL